jgi:hypothetical protein
MMNRLPLIGLFVSLSVFCGALPVHFLLAQENPESTPEATPNNLGLLETLIDAAFTTSRLNPLTGEPVELTLIVEVPPDAQLVDWPDFPEAWLPFEVSHLGEIEIKSHADGWVIYRQTITAYLWIPGEYETPETLIGYQLADVDDVYYVPVRPLLFTVPSSLETRDLNELERKPHRPPVSFFYLPAWSIIVLVSVLVVGIWSWLRWLEKRRLALATRVTGIPVAPHEVALTELARLRSGDLAGEGVYVGVSAALRAYIQERFDVAAADMTTLELMEALHDVPEGQLEAHLDGLNRILQQTDLVKFAKLTPRRPAVTRLIDLAYHWVIAVNQPAPQPEDSLDEVEMA